MLGTSRFFLSSVVAVVMSCALTTGTHSDSITHSTSRLSKGIRDSVSLTGRPVNLFRVKRQSEQEQEFQGQGGQGQGAGAKVTTGQRSWSNVSNSSCVVLPTDQNIHDRIRHMIDMERVNLIEYSLVFPRYNSSPLISNATVYKAESWARASNKHGQTLLSLSFNYGILSMMTLSVGTASLEVSLEDKPEGCVGNMTEQDQLNLILFLMLRDFQHVQDATVTGQDRLCHEAIVDHNGYAKFEDMCCYEDPIEGDVICEPDVVNIWLRLLQLILSLVRIGILFFGPLLIAPTVISITRKRFPYIVKLKEPLTKSVVFHQGDVQPVENVVAKHCIDLRTADGYPKLRSCMSDVTLDVPVTVNISQYDIQVSYSRTLTENHVPVGFWRSIFGAVFRCKLRYIGPFRDCCSADMLNVLRKSACSQLKRRLWISFWSKVGLVLMVVLLPTPYYLRLFVFYKFEYAEVEHRKAAIARLGLEEQFSGNPLHFFTPNHPVFIFVYVTYFVTAAFIGLTVRSNNEGRILRVLAGAFDELASLPWTTVLHVVVGNVIWPFEKFGVVGCVVAVVYWPLALPLTVVFYLFYCLPTVYLTVRMIFYSRNHFLLRSKKRLRVRSYRARRQPDTSIHLFEADKVLERVGCRFEDDEDSPSPCDDLDANDLDFHPSFSRQISIASVASSVKEGLERNFGACCVRLMTSLLCVAVLYSVLIILSECVGCLLEIAFFTLMGVIVNAGVLLKYVALVVLLVAYSHDCFNDVHKNYLKLNKALFNEVKSRVKDFEQVTCQPSHLQENHGFKSQELSEQAYYENPDDVATRPPGHWLINDLVLFVDNEDMPRIPRKLFDQVCEIRVAGVPGPVYRGLMMAFQRFLKIVLFVFFVFIVVLSFSEAYKISSTNQMLATLAGGFLPLILRTFMGRDGDELELSTVSFRSKLDEVIKNFQQIWPMYDFPFELAPPEPEVEAPEVEAPTEDAKKSTGSVTEEKNATTENGVTENGENKENKRERRTTVTFAEEKSEDVVKVDLLVILPDSEDWAGCSSVKPLLDNPSTDLL